MNVNLFHKVYGLAKTYRQHTQTNKQWSDKTRATVHSWSWLMFSFAQHWALRSHLGFLLWLLLKSGQMALQETSSNTMQKNKQKDTKT